MTEEFESLYKLVFFSFAVALVALERIRALQLRPVRIAKRWISNIGLFSIGSIASAIVLPIGIYAFAQQQTSGFVSRLELPFAAQLLLTFLFLDFWRYWEHRLFHEAPLLWRLHLVHHSDTQIDVTTSERHHPLAFVLSTAILMVLVAAFGLPAAGLGVYLLVATLSSLYSHANVRFPASLDRPLRWIIVTPLVHAVHHSAMQAQTNSNYGGVLTLWDRFFGTYVDPESTKIERFGLAYFHRPSDMGLVRVLQQPFLFRRDFSSPAPASAPVYFNAAVETATEAPRLALTRGVKEALLSGIAGCVLIAWAMWPTVLQMVGSWQSEAYQYSWLVLPMIVYLLGWQHRAAISATTLRPDFSGVLVVAAAAVCWGAASLMNIDVGRQFALILSLQGIAMSTLGWRTYWRLLPTLALMFLMIPSGDFLEPALRVLTLNAIELFAVTAQLPYSVDGFVIFIGTHRYVVLSECAGLSYVTLATFLGYCFGLLLYRSPFKIMAMAMFGAFLGILTNVLRVNAIVLIDWIHDSQMDLTAHGTIQWIALLVTLGFLFYVLSRLKVEATLTAVDTAAPGQSHPARKFAPVVAGLSGLMIAASATALPTNEARAPRGGQSWLFPQNISGWVLENRAALWTVDQQGGTESVTLSYQRSDRDIQVVITETLSPSAKLYPESTLMPRDEGIWRERQIRKEVGCVGSQCAHLLHASWKRDKSEQFRHAYFAYSLGDLLTDSKFALRAAHGWHRLTGGDVRPRLIAVVSQDLPASVDEVADIFQRIQSVLVQQSPR